MLEPQKSREPAGGEPAPTAREAGSLPPPLVESFVLPGERVVRCERLEYPFFSPPLDAEECLARLCGAPTPREIGLHGPPIAAVPPPVPDAAPELRLFEALFGRDSLVISSLLMRSRPQVARTTILALASLQGLTHDPISEEEPGRIPHEHRLPDDPIRDRLEEAGWRFPYYGSVDATPLFVLAVCRYAAAHGDAILAETYLARDGKPRLVEDSLRLALDWIAAKLDSNREGLLAYQRSNPLGIANQCWKDSGDSFHHADGSLANHDLGIAAVEVQALAYDALREGALIFDQSDSRYSSGLLSRAGHLRDRVLSDLWIEDERGGYFALGADRDPAGSLRKLAVRTSNMGHLLDSSILEGDDPAVSGKRRALVATLFSPEMLCENGIRTLSSEEKLFRPFAYHNGSVWLWDNAIIARGLRRHGFLSEAENIENRIMRVCRETGGYPEFALGADGQGRVNGWLVDVELPGGGGLRVAQPPQPVQGWTVAAALAIETASTSEGGK